MTEKITSLQKNLIFLGASLVAFGVLLSWAFSQKGTDQEDSSSEIESQ